jgi:tyrosinase
MPTNVLKFFNSPNEPMFWLHHGNIDRMWWIWQNQQPVNRAFQIAGTRTMLNSPPSDNATIADILDMGFNAGPTAFKNLVSSVGGKFCYIYQ